MLRTSTKNVAHEVVSCLVDGTSGILAEITRWYELKYETANPAFSKTHTTMVTKGQEQENSLSFANAETEDEGMDAKFPKIGTKAPAK